MSNYTEQFKKWTGVPPGYMKYDTEPSWRPGPGTRSTTALLFSCLATLLLCVWTVLHPNIAPQKERELQKPRKWYSLWLLRSDLRTNRMVLMIFGFLMPEVLLWIALNQFLEARRIAIELTKCDNQQKIMRDHKNRLSAYKPHLKAKIKKAAESDQEKGIFKKMASFFKRLPPFLKRVRRRIFPKELEYGFYISMGGLEIESHEKDRKHLTYTITPVGAIFLARNGLLPKELSSKSIAAKGRSDAISKVLACSQGLWMVAQVLSRSHLGLPITLLEFHLAIHVVYALLTYFCWFCKPQSISEPTLIPDDDDNTLALLLCVRELVNANIPKTVQGHRSKKLLRWEVDVDDNTTLPSAILPESCRNDLFNFSTSAGIIRDQINATFAYLFLILTIPTSILLSNNGHHQDPLSVSQVLRPRTPRHFEPEYTNFEKGADGRKGDTKAEDEDIEIIADKGPEKSVIIDVNDCHAEATISAEGMEFFQQSGHEHPIARIIFASPRQSLMNLESAEGYHHAWRTFDMEYGSTMPNEDDQPRMDIKITKKQAQFLADFFTKGKRGLHGFEMSDLGQFAIENSMENATLSKRANLWATNSRFKGFVVSVTKEDGSWYLYHYVPHHTLVLLVAMTLVFHCIPWNWKFPTYLERRIWRASSVTVAVMPFLSLLLNKLKNKLNKFIRRRLSYMQKWKNSILGIFYLIYTLPYILYTLTCILLILFVAFEPFIAIRRLPLGSYKATPWANYFPHI
ncbi:hypothetical protein DFH27DRAFT_553542 [Peziza echinospora]|nr:hypothetical protein DFH27DRAFT_553542 [Peziza echinospora]